MIAQNLKPFVSVYNPSLPLDHHHIRFHGSIAADIVKLIYKAFEGKVKDEVNKALT